MGDFRRPRLDGLVRLDRMDSVLIDKRVTSVISDKNNLFSYRKLHIWMDKDEPIYLFFVRGLDERVCLGFLRPRA